MTWFVVGLALGFVCGLAMVWRLLDFYMGRFYRRTD